VPLAMPIVALGTTLGDNPPYGPVTVLAAGVLSAF